MEAYKFETMVLTDGIIKIPEISNLANKPVEIFIVVKQERESIRSSENIDHFLKKWTGCIKGADPDDEFTTLRANTETNRQPWHS